MFAIVDLVSHNRPDSMKSSRSWFKNTQSKELDRVVDIVAIEENYKLLSATFYDVGIFDQKSFLCFSWLRMLAVGSIKPDVSRTVLIHTRHKLAVIICCLNFSSRCIMIIL